MLHYPSIIGGRLAEVFKRGGDIEVRLTTKLARVYNRQYDTACNLCLLEQIPSERVAKLSKKRNIDRERFAELLKGATVPTP